MATIHWPHYKRVVVKLEWEHSNESQQSHTYTLTPDNSTDNTRDAVVHGVTSFLELIRFTQAGPAAGKDGDR